jgi:AcrR family transcriptional regulator
MRNAVPVAHRIAEAGVETRLIGYAEEVRRLIDAAYATMRASGSIDPSVRDIVRASGLSNQTFYRHFRSKDALLHAVLADGQDRLVATIEKRSARADGPEGRVRAWIEAVLDQARRAEAAENTRPFAVNGPRLADRFPEQSAQSAEAVIAPLRAAIAELGGDERDARAVYELAMGTMNRHLVARTQPTRRDGSHLVTFALAGIAGGRQAVSRGA